MLWEQNVKNKVNMYISTFEFRQHSGDFGKTETVFPLPQQSQLLSLSSRAQTTLLSFTATCIFSFISAVRNISCIKIAQWTHEFHNSLDLTCHSFSCKPSPKKALFIKKLKLYLDLIQDNQGTIHTRYSFIS